MSITDVTGRFPLEAVWWRQPFASNQDVTDIAIHHTVMFFLSPDATVEDELNQLAMIYRNHIGRGLGGIGYHGVSFPSGRAYLTSPLTHWGAHVSGENDDKWGFAAAGTYTDSIPPEPLRQGLAELIAMADSARAQELPLRPHRHWTQTTCPGKPWQQWVPTLREEYNMPTLDEIRTLIQEENAKLPKPLTAEEVRAIAEAAAKKYATTGVRQLALEALDHFDKLGRLTQAAQRALKAGGG